jgi:hypothetical protein
LGLRIKHDTGVPQIHKMGAPDNHAHGWDGRQFRNLPGQNPSRSTAIESDRTRHKLISPFALTRFITAKKAAARMHAPRLHRPKALGVPTHP